MNCMYINSEDAMNSRHAEAGIGNHMLSCKVLSVRLFTA